MDIDKIDVFTTLGLCITLPKSVAALNRAMEWVEQTMQKDRYYFAYYDFSRYQRHKIGKYTSLQEAVQARNTFEMELVDTKTIKGILLELARYMRNKLHTPSTDLEP